MSPLPPPQDTRNYLFDLSSTKGPCHDPSFGYHPSYQSIVPTPIFSHESPLFFRDSAGESASATDGTDGRGQTRAEIERLSARPYSVRVSDPEDFARVWEMTVVPIIIDILQGHYDGDFSVDVHNFPELSSDSVPRVIFITLPIVASGDLQDRIREELARKVPPRFRRTHLKFRQGEVVRSNWWGTDKENLDPVCEPKNNGFQAVPTLGMSVGPRCSSVAGSLGGFIKLGDDLYGMSCRHVFEEAVMDGDMRVVHPAQGDRQLNQTKDMGRLILYSRPASTRESLTFQGTGVSKQNQVEMDWCLFGPVPEGKNFLSVPSFDMDRLAAIETSAMIEGNTEVYALGRTSGYSLGFTSDMPGILKMEGVIRREWTVRQYSPSNWDAATHMDPSWQSVKHWVTSGIGMPGDSGAWLMRRSDNAVLALIWARNHNHGSPVERVRLTYVTPMVDILQDIKARGYDDVSLPRYSPADVRYSPNKTINHGHDALGIGRPSEPWNHLSTDELGRHRENEGSLIAAGVYHGNIYPSALRRSCSTDGRQMHGDTSEPHASTSVQASVDVSNTTQSVSPSSRTGTGFPPGEDVLLGIGAAAVFQLGQAGLLLPGLEADTGSSCSGPSIMTLDEPEPSNAGGLVQIAGQVDPNEDWDNAHTGHFIRSKATFPSLHMERTFLVSRPGMV